MASLPPEPTLQNVKHRLRRLGRNDPCWCGSGTKFKKCHLNRETQVPEHPFERAQRQSQEFRRPTCLHPLAGPAECAGPIVKAHTVRRASDLKSIAVNGHVIQFQANYSILRRTGGRPEPAKIGINKASTFNGFCQRHDTQTFRPVEATAFSGTSEQCFLLMFRAVCRETHAKEASARATAILREADKGRPLAHQLGIQAQLNAHERGVLLGLRDVRAYKATLDAALLNRDFAAVTSVVFEFDGRLPIVCSGAFHPYYDIEGRVLQTFDPSVTPQPLTLTLLNESGTGYAVLSWLKQASDAPSAFAAAIAASPNISDATCRAAVVNFENFFASPTWWEGLAQADRDEISRRVADNVDLFTPFSRDIMRPSGAPLLSLGLQQRFWA